MPVNYGNVPQIDFSPLAKLGDIYQQNKIAATRERSLAALAQGASPDQIGRMLAQSGDTEGALQFMRMGQMQANRQSDVAFREQQAAQAQARHQEEMALRKRALDEGRLPAGFERTQTGMQPITGGPADPAYKRTVTDRQNAPPGYKWKDPNNPDVGLLPIPGGPGEKMDAEVAGRVGMAKSFLGQLDDYTDAEGKPQVGLRKRIKGGEMTGPFDAARAWAGMGGPGEVRRILDSGAEALLRNLTGAGMNKEEAAQYVRRYQFHPTDNATTAGSKLNQLERELRSVVETVGRGRGGAGEAVSPSAEKKRLKFNPATGDFE